LPKAHVEAPAIGSIILAGVLLKLGAYGLYRFYFFVLQIPFLLLVRFRLWGALLAALISLRQVDLKSLIAFSSISHIGVLVGGLCLFFDLGVKGAFIILIAHGFCSSALFYLVNTQYERILRRQLIVVRGRFGSAFILSVFWFFFLVINLRAPPFLSLFGEIPIFFFVFLCRAELIIILGLTRFFVAYYCLYLYRTVVHGASFKSLGFLFEEELTLVVLIYHFLPLIFLVVVVNFFWFYLVSLSLLKYKDVGLKSFKNTK